ncbi:MAG: hypothetical protein JJ899_02275 [Alphaproteobacteria bacterium]|nr:hypothetical protein [Alphaproteobacteria bacterium]
MNRIALFILATLTGAGAVYAVWTDLSGGGAVSASVILQAIAAVVIVAATAITWEAVITDRPERRARLKRTALVVLVVGIAGLGANAFFGGTTKAPDGAVFAVSLLLILQAFLTIGYASRGA